MEEVSECSGQLIWEEVLKQRKTVMEEIEMAGLRVLRKFRLEYILAFFLGKPTKSASKDSVAAADTCRLPRHAETIRNVISSNANSVRSTTAAKHHTVSADDNFHSSIPIRPEKPVTIQHITGGPHIGDKVIWFSWDDEPENGVVRWIGRIRGQLYAGVEFETCIGNSSGLYGYGEGLVTRLFQCDLGYGKFVPLSELILTSDYYDKGTRAGFICIICLQDFLKVPDSEGHDHAIVSTTCGHLFHSYCLNHWKKDQQDQKASTRKVQKFRCPYCRKLLQDIDIIRLFLV